MRPPGLDVVVIRLPSPAPKGSRPIPLYAGASSTSIAGPTGTIIGYGDTASAGECTQALGELHPRRLGVVFTAGLSLGQPSIPQIMSAPALLWQRTQPTEDSMTIGDAGGPLLVGNPPTVAGVFTSIPQTFPPCDRQAMEFAPVAENRSWLDPILLPPEPDDDGDGIPNSCDICPSSASEIDTDGDGIGDACDKCKHDADNDLDGDGVCADEDNCPAVSNADQLNSNLLSETFHTPGDRRGDRCEPVPVPAGRAVASGTTTLLEVNPNGCSAFSFCQRIWSAEQNRIVTRAVRSNLNGSTFQSVNGVTTHSRFCPKPLLPTDPICDDENATDDDRLTDAPNAQSEVRIGQPYHRITVTGESRGQTRVYDYGYIHGNISSPAPYQYVWDYVADRQFWENYDKAPVPPNVENTNPIEGLFWQHADTNVGATVNLGTGLHGQQVANSHFDAKASKIHNQKSIPNVGPNNWQWWLWPMAQKLPGLVGAAQHQAHVVLPYESTVSFIASNNWVFEATAQFGSQARQAMLSTGARWVSQAEPQSYRADFSDVVGLVVNAEGTFITERLLATEDGQGIVGAKDLDPNAQPVRLSPNPLGTFQVVLARSLGQVYVLSEGQIWSGPIDPSAGTIGLMMPDAPIGTVLAATYEPISRALFALRSDGALVKIPLFGGVPATVATVPRVGNWEQYYLVPDRDGSVFVALAIADEYAVWVLSPSLSFTLGRQRGTGLPVAPVVELDGYLMVERVAPDQVVLKRIPAML